MLYKISKSDFEFLKKYSENSILIAQINENKSYIIMNVDNDDVDEFEFLLNCSVLDFGMNDENTVNHIGKRLYNIYDNLLYQKHQQEEKGKNNDSE